SSLFNVFQVLLHLPTRLHIFIDDMHASILPPANPQTHKRTGKPEIEGQADLSAHRIAFFHFLPEMLLFPEIRKYRVPQAWPPAQHLRFPRLAAHPPFHGDGILDPDKPIALRLGHTLALLPQGTASAVPLRWASPQNLQQTPPDHGRGVFLRVLDN